MSGMNFLGSLVLCALFLPLSEPSGQLLKCHEVRSSFQFLYPGTKWAPETPVSGSDLQVCQSKGLTCCSRKMEERYLLTAKQNLESNLQASSAHLKLLIIQNAALFQDLGEPLKTVLLLAGGRPDASSHPFIIMTLGKAFDMVLRLGRNSTLTLLREEFPGLGSAANGAATQLFLEMSLYILGSDANVDDMVISFFSRLFPLAYRHLLGNGAAAGMSDECMQRTWREVSAFGSYPKLMMTRLSRSLLATRVFLQALNLGIEVVNTTQHLKAGRECGRTLLRLWYCPLCQGLMEARPCKAMCLVTMGTCLGGASEVQPHWKAYVEGLDTLAAAMRGVQDIEAVVLRLHVTIRMALRHIVGTKHRVNEQVSSMCSHTPKRKARAVTSPVEPALVIQPVNFDPDETLSGQRREFIQSLRGFSLFYANLGETLCSREPAALNGSLCWNGQEMTDRFSGSVPRKSHPHGSDTKHKQPEPVVSQIIDKLKHINQLLRMVTSSEKRWRARPGGGTARKDPGRLNQGEEDEEGLESGDCDDEDECAGVSGLGPPTRRKRLRIFAGVATANHLSPPIPIFCILNTCTH
ncbi:hypothetical protein QTP70_021189 [Hemibagrus guttatus]|uniref:Glypican-3 n=1 Tax=Hemibagrus guttatus TaxID=175788 RepID=A0AAE0QY09_9TELE|nr:hypothetical protein QTP70_021189 [Hemibagrus guttatus]